MKKGTFLGLLLVLIGLMFILRAVFNIYIPILRFALGAFLIYWGLEMLSDAMKRRKRRLMDSPGEGYRPIDEVKLKEKE